MDARRRQHERSRLSFTSKDATAKQLADVLRPPPRPPAYASLGLRPSAAREAAREAARFPVVDRKESTGVVPVYQLKVATLDIGQAHVDDDVYEEAGRGGRDNAARPKVAQDSVNVSRTAARRVFDGDLSVFRAVRDGPVSIDVLEPSSAGALEQQRKKIDVSATLSSLISERDLHSHEKMILAAEQIQLKQDDDTLGLFSSHFKDRQRALHFKVDPPSKHIVRFQTEEEEREAASPKLTAYSPTSPRRPLKWDARPFTAHAPPRLPSAEVKISSVGSWRLRRHGAPSELPKQCAFDLGLQAGAPGVVKLTAATPVNTSKGSSGGPLGLAQPLHSTFISLVTSHTPLDKQRWLVDVGMQDDTESVVDAFLEQLRLTHSTVAQEFEAQVSHMTQRLRELVDDLRSEAARTRHQKQTDHNFKFKRGSLYSTRSSFDQLSQQESPGTSEPPDEPPCILDPGKRSNLAESGKAVVRAWKQLTDLASRNERCPHTDPTIWPDKLCSIIHECASIVPLVLPVQEICLSYARISADRVREICDATNIFPSAAERSLAEMMEGIAQVVQVLLQELHSVGDSTRIALFLSHESHHRCDAALQYLDATMSKCTLPLTLDFEHCVFQDAAAVASVSPCSLQARVSQFVAVKALSLKRCINVLPGALEEVFTTFSCWPQPAASLQATAVSPARLTYLSLHGTPLPTAVFTALMECVAAPPPPLLPSSSSSVLVQEEKVNAQIPSSSPPTALVALDVARCGLHHTTHLEPLCDALRRSTWGVRDLVLDGFVLPPRGSVKFLRAVEQCRALLCVSLKCGERMPQSFSLRLTEIIQSRGR